MILSKLKKSAFLSIVCSLVFAAFIALMSFQSASTSRSQNHAFYYWKTRWEASPVLLDELRDQKISRLYMRFFDVKWNDRHGSPYPDSPLIFGSTPPRGITIVPVVYLTNNVFLNTSVDGAADLATKVLNRVELMLTSQKLNFRELQIDCDWTEHSRGSYFRFIKQLHDSLNPSGIVVSTTVRLHQIKYYGRTGIPPADRAMVMFYNFGRIEAYSERSSIFNDTDAIKYSRYLAEYPLALDVSLPLFSWAIHSRDGQVLGLLEKSNLDGIKQSTNFSAEGDHYFLAKSSFFFHGQYYRKGDKLILEETTPQTTERAAQLASEGAGQSRRFGTIALFDLDERTLKNYGPNEWQRIFSWFK